MTPVRTLSSWQRPAMVCRRRGPPDGDLLTSLRLSTPSKQRFYSTEATKTCWKCNESNDLLSSHCKACSSIQALPSDANLFKLLDLSAVTFEVDPRALRGTFLQKQQKVHPDSYAQSSSQEQELAQRQSSLLNKAYTTLADPLSRAQYMLELVGIQVGEAESLEDPELLMQVLEAREELESASSREDAMAIQDDNQVHLDQTISDLSEAFAKQDYDTAKILAIKLQYWVNIRNAAKDWEPGKRIEIQH